MRHIEVWYDETSDSDQPTYCISLCDEDGDEIKCLGTYDDRAEAESAGLEAATERGMECLYRDTSGQTSAI